MIGAENIPTPSPSLAVVFVGKHSNSIVESVLLSLIINFKVISIVYVSKFVVYVMAAVLCIYISVVFRGQAL